MMANNSIYSEFIKVHCDPYLQCNAPLLFQTCEDDVDFIVRKVRHRNIFNMGSVETIDMIEMLYHVEAQKSITCEASGTHLVYPIDNFKILYYNGLGTISSVIKYGATHKEVSTDFSLIPENFSGAMLSCSKYVLVRKDLILLDSSK